MKDNLFFKKISFIKLFNKNQPSNEYNNQFLMT